MVDTLLGQDSNGDASEAEHIEAEFNSIKLLEVDERLAKYMFDLYIGYDLVDSALVSVEYFEVITGSDDLSYEEWSRKYEEWSLASEL
jgi:hypothetical protein